MHASSTILSAAAISDRHGAVLIVADDHADHQALQTALQGAGYQVSVARASEDVHLATLHAEFDLMIVDIGGHGSLDLLRRVQVPRVPVIVTGASLTTRLTVEAMKLGAIDVIDNRATVEELVDSVRGRMTSPHAPARMQSGAVAERWASYVIKATEAEEDLKTLGCWARLVGVSYTGLRECCRLLDIRPYDARDLARTLRALIQAEDGRFHPQLLLDVSDARTLKGLIERAGRGFVPWKHPAAIDHFLLHQRFVQLVNPGFAALRKRLADRFLKPRA
jgi:FixJ family two-component response regulator